MWPGLRVKPVGIGNAELANKGQAGKIEKPRMRPRQRRLAGQQLFETRKGGSTTAAMCKRFVRIEAAGIFIAVKMRLERPIKPLKKRFNMFPVSMNGRKPTIWVMLIECPEHDVTALVDHPASGTL